MVRTLYYLLWELRANCPADIPSLPTSSEQSPSQPDWHAKLVKRRQAILANAFRDRMTKDQGLQRPNAYRQQFYREVIELADEVSFHTFIEFLSIIDIPSLRQTAYQFACKERFACKEAHLRAARGEFK